MSEYKFKVGDKVKEPLYHNILEITEVGFNGEYVRAKTEAGTTYAFNPDNLEPVSDRMTADELAELIQSTPTERDDAKKLNIGDPVINYWYEIGNNAGYNQGIIEGQANTWNLAHEILQMQEEDLNNIFKCSSYVQVFARFNATEVRDLLNAHSSLKVGDIVRSDRYKTHTTGIVTKLIDLCILWGDGDVGYGYSIHHLEKIGHLDIQKTLEQIHDTDK